MSSASQTPMPAMRKAFEAFNRWTEGNPDADCLNLDISAVARALGIDFQAVVTRPIPCPAPIARDCGICTQPMAALGSLTGDVSKDPNDDVKEEAKRLPCSHVLGLKCLEKWFYSFDSSNNNTCPYCRAVYFQKSPTESTAQARLDALDWHIQQRGTEATAEEAVQIQNLAAIILQDGLVDAMIELEQSRAGVDKEMAEQFGIMNATYQGPQRARCGTKGLVVFFGQEIFLRSLMVSFCPMPLGPYLEDDGEALVQYLFPF